MILDRILTNEIPVSELVTTEESLSKWRLLNEHLAYMNV